MAFLLRVEGLGAHAGFVPLLSMSWGISRDVVHSLSRRRHAALRVVAATEEEDAVVAAAAATPLGDETFPAAPTKLWSVEDVATWVERARIGAPDGVARVVAAVRAQNLAGLALTELLGLDSRTMLDACGDLGIWSLGERLRFRALVQRAVRRDAKARVRADVQDVSLTVYQSTAVHSYLITPLLQNAPVPRIVLLVFPSPRDVVAALGGGGGGGGRHRRRGGYDSSDNDPDDDAAAIDDMVAAAAAPGFLPELLSAEQRARVRARRVQLDIDPTLPVYALDMRECHVTSFSVGGGGGDREVLSLTVRSERFSLHCAASRGEKQEFKELVPRNLRWLLDRSELSPAAVECGALDSLGCSMHVADTRAIDGAVVSYEEWGGRLLWSPRNHRYFPAAFRAAVRTFLLCCLRARRGVELPAALGLLPPPVVLLVVGEVASQLTVASPMDEFRHPRAEAIREKIRRRVAAAGANH